MKIKINLTKKQIIPIISGVIILIGIIFVYAQSVPSPGHSINEIGGIPDCTSSQSLTHNSSGFFCMLNSANSGNIAVSGNLTVNNHLYFNAERVTRSGTSNGGVVTLSAPCSAGKKVVNCHSTGCYGHKGIFPVGNNSCYCNFGTVAGVTCSCIATCANIDS